LTAGSGKKETPPGGITLRKQPRASSRPFIIITTVQPARRRKQAVAFVHLNAYSHGIRT
jgi:hypothetical protein